jgi:gas vesicle protein
MIYENQHAQPATNNSLAVLAGVLIGGLAGAVTMLLMAPQSGKDTRTQLQNKGLELRDRTTTLVEDTLAKVRQDGNKLSADGRQKAHELMQQGQALVVEQLDRVSEAAQAGKKAIQSS